MEEDRLVVTKDGATYEELYRLMDTTYKGWDVYTLISTGGEEEIFPPLDPVHQGGNGI